MSVSYSGVPLLLNEPIGVLEDNLMVKWIAFIAALLQAFCIADQQELKCWFSKSRKLPFS
ncbi:MAG: hypothetical protein P4N59_15400 [Negativicutes bacterium]|nr:hypothetical protein [Negativicutes bacterium]